MTLLSLHRSGGAPLSGTILGLTAVFFWSTNALAAKLALTAMSVAQVVFLQFASAACVIALAAVLRIGVEAGPAANASLRERAMGPVLAFVGIVGTIAFQYLAFAHAPIAQANLIAYAWPLLTAVWLALIVRPPGSGGLVGLAALGFVGVGLLIGGPGVLAFELRATPGYLFAGLSALCMAVFTLGVARLSWWRVTAILPALGLGALLMAAISLLTDEALPPAWAVALGIYIGVGPMALGYALWSLAVRRDPRGHVAILAYLTPVASTLWLVVAGESLSPIAWLGAALVLLAITLLGLRGRAAPHNTDHAGASR